MKIAVVGASGAVGREILAELEESALVPKTAEVIALASPRSDGERLKFRGKTLTVRAFQLEAVQGCSFVLMSAGKEFSKEWSPKIAQLGAYVIDNSSAWRSHRDIPLVVPEVNQEVLKGYKPGIIANPNCSTIQMVVALDPLKKAYGLEMVQVATYQSVSGSGQKGITELSEGMKASFKFERAVPSLYEHPIAFNLIPYIGSIDDVTGYCEEELKMIQETRKILSDEDLPVLPTTVRVPVFHCHAEAVTVKLSCPVSREELIARLSQSKGLSFVADSERLNFPNPLTIAQKSGVYVCRARLLQTADGKQRSDWVQFWNVADNLKKGAATNAVQILESLLSL
ncbi:MAG: aspartate-semialdehyde dehydrogenase [Oligoflexales bacterium]|nr:aspartate-semialdehyde dehydrogenase [Oligoflexales bacterium]